MDDLTAVESLSHGDLAEGFRTVAAHITGDQRAKMQALYAAWQSGDVDDAEFETLLADALLVGSGAALISADALAAVWLNKPAHGLTVADSDAAPLIQAARTATELLDGSDDPLPRLERLAVAEPLRALQSAAVASYYRHGVTGYTRAVSPNACADCRAAHASGHVYPTDSPMTSHPGCTCVPIPITD